jgi:hypothetical protein
MVFIATNSGDAHRWTLPNKGSLATDLALLVDAGTTQDLVRRVNTGETVLVPGSFRLERIQEWIKESNAASGY